jgi:hypothetical protein
MRNLNIITTLTVLSAALAGCDIIEEDMGDTGSPEATDSGEVEDTDAEDTDVEDTDAEVGGAQVRFINTSDGDAVSFEVGDAHTSAALYFTQSEGYSTIPAGSYDVAALSESGSTLSNLIGYAFEDGKKYTITGLGVHGQGNAEGQYATIWVNVDVAADATDIPADHTRLTLVNAVPDDDELFTQIGYQVGTGDVEYYNFPDSMGDDNDFISFVRQSTLDLRYSAGGDERVYLASQVGAPAVMVNYWNGAAAVQVANNASMYLFMTCTGDCDSDEDLMPLFLMEDSSTFTVELE